MRPGTFPPLTFALVVAAIVTATQLPGTTPSTASPPAQKTATADATARPPDPWPITVLDTAAPAMVVDKDGMLAGSVVVANSTAAPQTVNVKVFLRSSRGRLVETDDAKPQVVQPGVAVLEFATRVTANTTDYPLNGLVILLEASAAPSTPRRVQLALSNIALDRPSESRAWQVVRSAGLVATLAVIVAVALLCLAKGAGALAASMGPSGSSLADGWSAALILGGPLLTALLGFVGFPEYPESMSKKSYMLLSVLLGGLIALAPNIYGLFRVPTPVTDSAGKPAIQNQGVAWLFIISAWFTLVGCTGQIALLQLVFKDLAAAGALPQELGSALGALMTLLWFAVPLYGAIAMANTVVSQYKLRSPVRGVDATRAPSELPGWSVL
jgi:hypothetical protein